MPVIINFNQLPEYLQKYQGTIIGVSDWKLIDQTLINKFAEVTNDFNFIHICPKQAKKTQFGSTIAHGFLTLSLISSFAVGIMPKIKDEHIAINYGFNKVRFMQPVLEGSRIRARFILDKYDNRLSNCIFIYYNVFIEIEHRKKPALKASWIVALNSI